MLVIPQTPVLSYNWKHDANTDMLAPGTFHHSLPGSPPFSYPISGNVLKSQITGKLYADLGDVYPQ
jgi:hypothetical protein